MEFFIGLIVSGMIFVWLLGKTIEEYVDKAWVAFGLLIAIEIVLALVFFATTYAWLLLWFPAIDIGPIQISSSNVVAGIMLLLVLVVLFSIVLSAIRIDKDSKFDFITGLLEHYVVRISWYLLFASIVLLILGEIFDSWVTKTFGSELLDSFYFPIVTSLFLGSFGFGILGWLSLVISLYVVDKANPDE